MTQTLPTLGTSPGTLPPPPFLTAEWRHLAMLNYEIDPSVLEPLVPRGTELDFWHGRAFVSLVGFQFLNARIHGLSIPFHRNFPEVNLRFYAIRRHDAGDRRAVVFVREIVPRIAVAAVARLFYNEHFSRMPMRHRITHDPLDVEYAWRFDRRWCRLRVRTSGGTAQSPAPGSLEEFIAEHYWAYTRRRDGGANEYQVEHRPWRIWEADGVELDASVEELYGKPIAAALRRAPASAFVADGSAVVVRNGVRIW
jgi:uncharacterized protein